MKENLKDKEKLNYFEQQLHALVTCSTNFHITCLESR